LIRACVTHLIVAVHVTQRLLLLPFPADVQSSVKSEAKVPSKFVFKSAAMVCAADPAKAVLKHAVLRFLIWN